MIAEKTRLADKARLRPCSDCQELLRFDVKLGWVHVGMVDKSSFLGRRFPGGCATWVGCPSRGEPQPKVAE